MALPVSLEATEDRVRGSLLDLLKVEPQGRRRETGIPSPSCTPLSSPRPSGQTGRTARRAARSSCAIRCRLSFFRGCSKERVSMGIQTPKARLHHSRRRVGFFKAGSKLLDRTRFGVYAANMSIKSQVGAGRIHRQLVRAAPPFFTSRFSLRLMSLIVSCRNRRRRW